MQNIWIQISPSSQLWHNSLLSVLTLAQQRWAHFVWHSNKSHQSFKSSSYPLDIIHTEFCKEVFDTVSSHIFTFYKELIHWSIFLLIKGIIPHCPLVKAVILTLRYLFSVVTNYFWLLIWSVAVNQWEDKSFVSVLFLVCCWFSTAMNCYLDRALHSVWSWPQFWAF